MEKQRAARQAALVKQLECGCPDSTCSDGKSCSHPMRRITSAKTDIRCSTPSSLPANSVSSTNTRTIKVEGSNQVSSTTGSGNIVLTTHTHTPKVYSRETRTIHENAEINHSNQNQHIMDSNPIVTTTAPPLVLSLSQIQGGGGLLILNSTTNTSTNSSVHQSLVSPVSVASFVCSTNNTHMRNNQLHSKNHILKNNTLVLKQETMNPSVSCCMQPGKISNITTNALNRNIHNSAKLDGHTVVFDSTYSRREKGTMYHNGIVTMTNSSNTSKQINTSNSEDIIQFKHNFCGDTVVLLGTSDTGNTLMSKSDGTTAAAIINSAFCNETLDLSQEDIQRTLSANMPLCNDLERRTNDISTINENNPVIASKKVSNHNAMLPQNTTSEINPMDFIDCTDVVVSPTQVVDDDVFVNLDAFDMLGEFPELEVLDASNCIVGSDTSPSRDDPSPDRSEIRESIVNITDYSPEWAYPEGGIKVLVTGPWYSTSTPYTVLFDTFPVPTTLVQSGVLRCFCPGMYSLIIADLTFF